MQQRGTIKAIIAAAIVAVAAACHNGRGTDALLTSADSLLRAGAADSAMSLLDSMEARLPSFSRAAHMRFRLLQADAMNKTYRDFTTDSVMREVADYYDHHGTPNERLRAYYLLGCTYRDLHEAPRAIECFQNAIDNADTTCNDCDIRTLGCLYSQMADLCHKQLLLTNALECRQKSIQYSLLVDDTLNAIYDYGQTAATYILLNNYVTAERILLKARDLYIAKGHDKEWAQTSTMLMYIYLRQGGRTEEVKMLLDFFVSNSGFFNDKGELPPSKCMFYRYFGQYYEQIHNLDSAEIYFRKMCYPDMKFTHRDAMYNGLLRIFQERENVDSITKYTHLYCANNDSSIALKDRETMANMIANYNYTRAQHQAQEEKENAEAAHRMNILLFAAGIVLIITFSFVWFLFRQRQKRQEEEQIRLEKEYQETKTAYENRIQELTLLEETHKKVTELIQHDLELSNEEAIRYQTRYNEAQRKMGDEVKKLQQKIEILKQRLCLTEDSNRTYDFRTSEVAQRILKLARKSIFELQQSEWNTLLTEFEKSQKAMLHDLYELPSVNQNIIRVCVLLILGLRETEIAQFIGIGNSAVSNIKSDVNTALFNEKTSRTLHNNLRRRYGIDL